MVAPSQRRSRIHRRPILTHFELPLFRLKGQMTIKMRSKGDEQEPKKWGEEAAPLYPTEHGKDCERLVLKRTYASFSTEDYEVNWEGWQVMIMCMDRTINLFMIISAPKSLDPIKAMGPRSCPGAEMECRQALRAKPSARWVASCLSGRRQCFIPKLRFQ